MLCKMFRHANAVSLGNLVCTSVVVCLAIFVTACSRDPANSQNPAEDPWSVELREAEYKTAMHPEKRYFATILPEGVVVRFPTAQGNFGSYTFLREEFPLGEPAFLSCPGSPDLLPMRVVRLNDSEVNQKYKIEWLAEPPATSDGVRVVRSRR